jgi:peptide chain release factor 1
LESGGHRIQRVPPTESRGRIHTSTVTVAVLQLASETVGTVAVDTKTVRIEWFSGTGAGGQHRNKHQNSCRLIHEPTGIVVTSQQRKRDQSYATAFAELERRVIALSENQIATQTNDLRNELTGSGMRADKIRTYRFQDDQVKDHNSNKQASATKVMKGYFNLLH